MTDHTRSVFANEPVEIASKLRRASYADLASDLRVERVSHRVAEEIERHDKDDKDRPRNEQVRRDDPEVGN